MKQLLVTLCLATLSYAAQAQDLNMQQVYRPLPDVLKLTGTYKGLLPCEDCKAIATELELRYSTDTVGEYSLRDKYMGKHGADIASHIKGEWIATKDKIDGQSVTLIVLNYEDEEKVAYYLLNSDGSLLVLDQSKHKADPAKPTTLKKDEPLSMEP